MLTKELEAIIIKSVLGDTITERRENMNSDAVKAKIVFNGMKIDEFISLVNHELSNNGYSGMSRSTYYKNLRGEQEFSRSEIQAISKVLSLSDEEVLNIFFDE